MFYEPGKTDHNLPHDPFKACVIPRPIGWISTISPPNPSATPDTANSSTSNSEQPPPAPTVTHNLAPYSQFNNLTFDPPYVMFSANQTPWSTRKDTVRNAEATGKFCWNLATYALRDAVNASAEQVPYGEDEFARAGLTKAYSRALPGAPVPMVAESPVNFECVYHGTLRLPGNPPMGSVDVVIGRVVGVHIKEQYLTDGKLDVRKTMPIARCGYYEYVVVGREEKDVFEMVIPGLNEAMLGGLEGSVRKHRLMQGSEVSKL